MLIYQFYPIFLYNKYCMCFVLLVRFVSWGCGQPKTQIVSVVDRNGVNQIVRKFFMFTVLNWLQCTASLYLLACLALLKYK